MVDRMKCCPESIPVDVLPYTMQCTLEMICATSMGLDVLEKADNKQFVDSMEVFLRKVATRIFHPLSYIDVIYRRTENYSQLERARHFCLDYAKQTIDKRRAALENQSISTKEDHEFRRKIIIDQVLEMDGDDELNDQNLRDQIMTFVAAVSNNIVMSATF
uniref:Cytochrome P450 4e2 n=1 Tax=Culex pipiens TaxID=7175 RepID=A0A8D8JA74_CULPI